MGRVADLLSAVAAAAEEGGEGLALRPEDRALLLEGWSESDLDDALSLVQDSLMLGELVEAADTVASRLMALLGAFGDADAFEQARQEGGRVPLEVIAHLARNVDWLDEVLSVYRDEAGPDRSGFEALRQRLAEAGIEDEMDEDRFDDGEPAES
jgi:hypothetical protein